MAMTFVSTATVGSGGAASIEFTNIPQTGRDLVCVFSTRDTKTTGNPDQMRITLSGVTTNYTNRQVNGTGSTTEVLDYATSGFYFERTSQPDFYTNNTFSNGSIYITNYATTSNKLASFDSVTENSSTAAYQTIGAGQWANSTTVTSLKIEASSNFKQYSTASLYIIS